MTSPSHSELLKAISISFENENASSSSCVEMNLSTTSSPSRRRIMISNDGLKNDECDSISSDDIEASPESRNDRENPIILSPQVHNTVPSSIFRHNNSNHEAPVSSSIDEQLTDQSSANNSQTNKHNIIEARKSDVPDNRPSLNSISYDRLFEVKTSDKGHTHVGSSMNPLFEELSQISPTTITNSDMTLEQASILDRKRSLLARADELLSEARKAISSSQSSVVSEPNHFMNNFSSDVDLSNKEERPSSKDIRRTQSLDRVLSTREVLELATEALREKEKSKERRMSSTGRSQLDPLNYTSRSSSESQPPSTRSHQQHDEQSVQIESVSLRQESSSEQQRPSPLKESALPMEAPQNEDCKAIDIPSDQNFAKPTPEMPMQQNNPESNSDRTKEIVNSDSPTTGPRHPRDKVLKRLDGIEDKNEHGQLKKVEGTKQLAATRRRAAFDEPGEDFYSRMPPEGKKEEQNDAFSIMRFLWGGHDEDGGNENRGIARINPAMLACGQVATGRQVTEELKENNNFTSLATSLMRRTSKNGHNPHCNDGLIKADSRLLDWVDNHFAHRDGPPKDGSYCFGKSRTVIVHEIVRGNWTWASAWSPDGTRLAIATENHHLAIIDTRTSVFRVRHDKRIAGPIRNDTTHSIRSIAWGPRYIAIGGTGNAVSILATTEPYPILHVIKGVGFVGSLDWKLNSNVLAIGSRLDRALLVRIRPAEDRGSSGTGRELQSDIIQTIRRKNWVNAVAFSPGGIFLAVGDAEGLLSIYRYDDRKEELSTISTFTMEDSILAISFSPDGKFLYSAGEDFRVTCIDTNHWEIVHRIRRDRWVQCVAASRGGTHVAVGGVTSEISILEVNLGWDAVINVELKGLVPLSCSWHPKDHMLCLAGQSKNILVVETTNARHIPGSCLRSCSSIINVKFSPDGKLAVVGNEDGILTFFKWEGDSFLTAYEMVVMIESSLCIELAANGRFAAIGSDDALIIVGYEHPTNDRTNRPANSSGFSVRKIIRKLGPIKSISIDCQSRYIVVCGATTRIFDTRSDYRCLRVLEPRDQESSAWSLDGRWLAMIGQSKALTIYDTDSEDCGDWREVFSIEAQQTGLAVAWGPSIVGGLAYLAFGGDDKSITIVEIRAKEGTWEQVLRAPRDDVIRDLDWNVDGLLAAGVANGTVSILDLSYLQSGLAVNELSYNAQRQAMTCFTELRRNRGRNSMRAVCWVPASPGSESLLAVGGSDGQVEIIDLTNREKCRGYREQSSIT